MSRQFISAVTVVFIATFTLASCETLESAPAKVAARADTKSETGGGREGIETGELNQKVDACTDFYEFANGTWRNQNPIPSNMQRWSRRVAARNTNQQHVQGILEELSQASLAMKTGRGGNTEQLLGDHYASCMNEAGIDALGLAPLTPLLDEINNMRNMADVQRVIRRLHEPRLSRSGTPAANSARGTDAAATPVTSQ